MTIGELKKYMEGMPDDTIVTVFSNERIWFTDFAEEDLSVDTGLYKRELAIWTAGEDIR